MGTVLKLDIVPYGAVLVCCTTKRDWRREYKHAGGKGNKNLDCHGMCSRIGATYIVGVFGGGANTLVHELTHVAMFEAVRTNFHTDNSNDEALAYLMGYLTGQCLKGLPCILEQT
jgi:hypothetical protein